MQVQNHYVRLDSSLTGKFFSPLIELTYAACVHSFLNKNGNFTNEVVLIIWQLANNMQRLEHAYVVQVTKANTGNVNVSVTLSI